MIKALHIVFGRIARRTLLDSSLFCEKEMEAIQLSDNLCLGPLPHPASDKEWNSRKAWFQNEFSDYEYLGMLTEAIDDDSHSLAQIVEKQQQVESLYLWTGTQASEQLATARVISAIGIPAAKIYVMQYNRVSVKNIEGRVVTPRSLVATASFQVAEIANHFLLQHSTDLLHWQTLWREACSTDSLLRIIDAEGQLQHVSVDYFDPSLLSFITGEFQSAARIIGYTLVAIDFAMGDTFLNQRLKAMAQAGRIAFRGTLKEMRNYQVRTL